MKNRVKFIEAKEATTYDNLLLDGSISNADVRNKYAGSGLHKIPVSGIWNKDINTDILISYLLTCDPPTDVNGRSSSWGDTSMFRAAYNNNTSAVKVLIGLGGDRTIKTKGNAGSYSIPNMTPLDVAKDSKRNNQETIKLLTECFPSEE